MKLCPKHAKEYNIFLNPQKGNRTTQLECELCGYTHLDVGEVEPPKKLIGLVKQRVAKLKKEEDADRERWNKRNQTAKRDKLLKTQAKTDADLNRLDGVDED